ncbi:molybdopterin-guanine dinucleotide biosynthesis protein A [Streptosporangium becharense]|uniref:Molybdopterin-guanine dinucleotide biosynthesis protein A n=1 Tax=Streptosporangium becharense TaxID=1816182 RepID=A0A7W9IBW8_9ACTN|nr:NTP transferase domain-containing protein [Streptosporangium becharense]MBB2913801.1 molybdopterin-guanine dinucleotide biosynthesis protein A [Streptosporangium becharense]MBB5817882.1 molybdopterin-guanine dinucleotide biosynthesis protein A [Streptosporangium becharense]
MTPRHDACILAGGLARRLGGRDKPGLRVLDRPLVESVAAAVPGAERLIVVGPPRPGLPRAIFRREDPPGAGPVPALRAGLAEVTAPWTVLLAADLPFLKPGHVTALLEAAAGAPPETGTAIDAGTGAGARAAAGAVLVDDDGHPQWLTGVWRTQVLSGALARYQGRSLHGLLAPLAPVTLRLAGRPWFDCDTADDLRRARDAAPDESRPHDGCDRAPETTLASPTAEARGPHAGGIR